jgi:hypothetical protein
MVAPRNPLTIALVAMKISVGARAALDHAGRVAHQSKVEAIRSRHESARGRSVKAVGDGLFKRTEVNRLANGRLRSADALGY